MGREDSDPVCRAEIKIKRSVFVCSLARVSTTEAAKDFISRVSKEHKTANHNCWAYIVGDQGGISHSSDAGEPAGTAGKPMLNTLTSHDMTHVAAVVTRYFGGVKLGIRGLIQAYSQAVEAALAVRPLVKQVNTCSFQIRLAYDFNDIFLNRITPFDPEVRDTRYADIIEHLIEVEDIHLEAFEKLLAGYAGQSRLRFEKID